MDYKTLCPYCGSGWLDKYENKNILDSARIRTCLECKREFTEEEGLDSFDFIYSTLAQGRTTRDAAEEFARNYWDKPRQIESFTECAIFRVVDGMHRYYVGYDPGRYLLEPAEYLIYRLKEV